jgi:uncharacterized protein (DUF2062 family)
MPSSKADSRGLEVTLSSVSVLKVKGEVLKAVWICSPFLGEVGAVILAL